MTIEEARVRLLGATFFQVDEYRRNLGIPNFVQTTATWRRVGGNIATGIFKKNPDESVITFTSGHTFHGTEAEQLIGQELASFLARRR